MLRSANRKADRKSSMTRKPRFQPRLEALESRVTPSCSWNPSTQVLTGTGDDTAWFRYRSDTGAYDVYCNFNWLGIANGFNMTFDAGPNSGVWFDDTNWQGGGQYKISANQIFWEDSLQLYFPGGDVKYVSLFMGSATNTVTVVPNAIQTSIDVYGGGPTKLIVQPLAEAESAIYDIEPNQVWLPYHGQSLGHFAVNEIEIRSGFDNDQIQIKNPAGSLGTMPLTTIKNAGGEDQLILNAQNYDGDEAYLITPLGVHMPNYGRDIVLYDSTLTEVELWAGSGNDDVQVGNNYLASVPEVTFYGGDGSDTLFLENSGGAWSEQYSVTQNVVTAANLGLVASVFYGVEKLTLNTGPFTDVITVGTPTGPLEELDFDLTLSGSGSDDVILDDTGYTGTGSYTVTSTTVSRTGAPTITLGVYGSLTLNAGSGDNLIDIESTLNPFNFINAGNGNDTLRAGGTSGKLDGLSSFLTLNGQAGTDTVWVNDVNSTTNNVYLGLSGSVGKLGGPTVLYGTAESFIISGGAGRDLMIAGSTPKTLQGGGGEDILIGGTTNYDNNVTALTAIMSEWTRTDQNYYQRVRHILRGGGVNGAYKLNPSTVHGNNLGNGLFGGAADKDFFFGNSILDTTDFDPVTEKFQGV